MDVELQSILAALPDQTRVFTADSLAMGDAAVRMCDAGATGVICLGVDFMAESVSAIMAKNGYANVPVYRATERAIGCSLAESAERLTYSAWLHSAKASKNPLHVVYINTSLETKAQSSSIIPTITCTSSNVLQTLLQSDRQVPDLSVYYGPDTCMGENLATMFDKVLKHWTDEDVRTKLHPEHDLSTIRRLHENLHVFPSGNCVVHHMFNDSVVKTVKESYPNAFISAHLEVPGEMFEIAMEASLTDRGVVGSTADILKFITAKCEEAANSPSPPTEPLQFILGTEAGMVTSIVKNVRKVVANTGVEAEIVFPVADEAVMQDPSMEGGIVPGVSGGEGCSTAGGCATCPFMKMNDVDAVMMIAETIAAGDGEKLAKHKPPQRLLGKTINGRDAVEMGVESILHMRHLMSNGKISDDLVSTVRSQSQTGNA